MQSKMKTSAASRYAISSVGRQVNQLTPWIRKHVQSIEFGFRLVYFVYAWSPERLVSQPIVLPLGF